MSAASPKGKVVTTPGAMNASPLSESDVTMDFEEDDALTPKVVESENTDEYKIFCCGNSLKDLGIIAACYLSIYAFVTVYYLFLLNLVISEGENNFNGLYAFCFVFFLSVTIMATIITFGTVQNFDQDKEGESKSA
jgi:hypothetical protein